MSSTNVGKRFLKAFEEIAKHGSGHSQYLDRLFAEIPAMPLDMTVVISANIDSIRKGSFECQNQWFLS